MDALTTWLQGPRTFRSRLLRLLVVRTAAFGAVVAGVLVGQVIPVQTSAAPLEPAPTPVPAWTAADALAHPECVPSAQWPEGRLAPAVVARRSGETDSRRIAFDKAWEMNHNATDVDDVWVVGVCA